MEKITKNGNFQALETGLGNKEQLSNFYQLPYSMYFFYKEKIHKDFQSRKIRKYKKCLKMTILVIFCDFQSLETCFESKEETSNLPRCSILYIISTEKNLSE